MEEQSESNKPTFLCTECGLTYSTQSNLNNHMRRKHKDVIFKPSHLNTIKCPLCSNLFSYLSELQKHIPHAHNVTLQQEDLQFDSVEEFREWKLRIEAENRSSYIVLNTNTRTDKTKTIRYVCHRSGKYIPNLQKKQRQREPKEKGSVKIQSHCPALITAKVSCKGDVKVRYTSTHIGHELEAQKLRMTSSDREEIAEKMLQGIPDQKILKDMGKNFNPLTRISYTTNDDLYNIKKAFKIESHVIFNQEDTIRVSVLIEKLKNSSGVDNPILLYKPFGEENDTIGTYNFLIVFMSSAQKKMLAKYGNNIIMIDSTQITNPYKIQLTTLMVINEDCDGLPVAFLWSSTQTEAIYQTFFFCIKERIPELKPRIFISDDCNTFYNAFFKAYEYLPDKVLYDWRVKRNLFTNLNKITLVDKRNEVREKIKVMVNELDKPTFQEIMTKLIIDLSNDDDTRKYGEYFVSNYVERPEQWAHCFQKDLYNSNMCLEKWHQNLKCKVQIESKSEKRLDVIIQNVLKCLSKKFKNNKEDSLFHIRDNIDDDKNPFISSQLCHNTGSAIILKKKNILENLQILADLITNSDNIEQICYVNENIETIISGFNSIQTLTTTSNHRHNKKLPSKNLRPARLGMNSLKRKGM